MSQRGKAVLAELLALPERERQSIINKAIKTITPEDDEDAAFLAELDRRWQEVVDGTAKFVSRTSLRKRKKALR